jgi:hypothetical protein
VLPIFIYSSMKFSTITMLLNINRDSQSLSRTLAVYRLLEFKSQASFQKICSRWLCSGLGSLCRGRNARVIDFLFKQVATVALSW